MLQERAPVKSDGAKRVVICGGGLMGAAAAYSLSKRGIDTLVVEMDGIGSGASGGSAGILGLNVWEGDHPLEPLKQLSVALHERLGHMLSQESALDYQYARIPFVLPAFNDDDVSTLQEWESTREGLRWLDQREARGVCPWLGPDAMGGLIQRETFQVNSYRLNLSLIAAAERWGAKVRSGRVSGVRIRGGRATDVEIDGELVSAAQILLTMGPWTGEAEAWFGVPVPVEPLRGQLVKLQADRSGPWCGIWYRDDYVMPKVEGLVTAGTTRELAGFDTRTTSEGRDYILGAALQMAPGLASARVVEQTACLRPASEDGLPLIGAIPGCDNVFLCTGHGGNGTVLSIGSAEAIAELMTTGQARSVDIAPFDPARFLSGTVAAPSAD